MSRDYVKFNLLGDETFGRLTYTGKTFFEKKTDGTNERMIEALCECGTLRKYSYDQVRRGSTRSCGCLKQQVDKDNLSTKTHGLTGHRLYSIWLGTRERCYYEKHKSYSRYGKIGIAICPEWKDDFKSFYDWAMSNGYNDNLSLDRKDGEGNYTPENCRFATNKQQSRNRSSNVYIEAFGESKTIVDWAEDGRCVVPESTLRTRLFLKGRWTIEQALTTPAIHSSQVDRKTAHNNILEAFGEEKTLAEWVEDERCTVNLKQLRSRLIKKWTPEKSISGKLRK